MLEATWSSGSVRVVVEPIRVTDADDPRLAERVADSLGLDDPEARDELHDQLRCGNDTVRTPHPCELWGPQWMDGLAPEPSAAEQDHEHPLPLPR